MATAASLATIQKAYVAYYGRPADPLGLAFWADQLDAANGNLDAIINAFGTSAEATEIYGKLSFAAAVNALYQQQFGRDAELDGLKFYVDGLQKGTFTLASLALNIADGASGADLTALTSKLQAADAFTAAINTTAEVLGYSGDAAAAAARAQLAAVTDAASLAAFDADAALSAVVAVGADDAAKGQTFTLTTGADNIKGTAGNDTITANVDTIANGGTFNAADVIDGGAGTDTFNLTLSDSGQFPAGAVVQNVEILNIRDVSAAAAAVTLAGFSGLEQVWSKGSTQDTEVSNVQNAVTVGMSGTAKNFKVGYAADKLGSATATQAVALDGAINGATAVTLELDVAGADKITKMSVTSSGSKSSVVVKGTAASTDVALTDLTVTGNAALTLAQDTTGPTGEFNGLKVINASGMTAGGLTIDLKGQAANVDMTFTGSAGNDKLTLLRGHLTNKDALDGGAGTDTLVLHDAGAADSINANANWVSAANAAGVKGFETIAISTANKAVAAGVTATLDLSAFAGATNAAINSDVGNAANAVLEVSNLTIGSTVSILAGQTGVVDTKFKPVDLASGNPMNLTVNVGNADTAAALTVATLGVTQVDNLTITSNGKGAHFSNVITELTAAQNTTLDTITITGNKGLTITSDLDVKGLTKIDASGLTVSKATDAGLTLGAAITNGSDTAKIEIIGSGGVDTILGSAKGDTIFGGLGADVITLGTAGATDIVRYTSAAESTSTAKDVITVFEGVRDVLKFEGMNFAGTFSLRTTADGFAGNGNSSAIIANTTLGGAQDLSIDIDGNGTADMVINLAGTGTLDLGNFLFA